MNCSLELGLRSLAGRISFCWIFENKKNPTQLSIEVHSSQTAFPRRCTIDDLWWFLSMCHIGSQQCPRSRGTWAPLRPSKCSFNLIPIKRWLQFDGFRCGNKLPGKKKNKIGKHHQPCFQPPFWHRKSSSQKDPVSVFYFLLLSNVSLVSISCLSVCFPKKKA